MLVCLMTSFQLQRLLNEVLEMCITPGKHKMVPVRLDVDGKYVNVWWTLYD